MNTFMFKFWNIPTKLALVVSAFFPLFIFVEGLLNGTLTSEPLFTMTTAVVMFYVINGCLKLLDDFL